MAHRQSHIRQLYAAAVLLLCVILSGAMLFSRLMAYAMTDHRQYIPLTQSSGITHVVTDREADEHCRADGFDPNRPIVLAAGPFLTADWFRAVDKNTVWKGKTQVEIFRVSYENGQGQLTVKSGGGDKVIAPGTENSYTFALENTAEGPLEYAISMKAYLSSEESVFPVKARVTRDTDKTYLLGSADAYDDVLALNKVSDSGTLKKNYVMPYTLSWQWPFEGNDIHDTMLGSLQEDLTLTIVIETTASYAPPTAEGGIPKTGDTGNIGMWFAMMLGSSAGLMCLLLLMRRKGETNEKA